MLYAGGEAKYDKAKIQTAILKHERYPHKQRIQAAAGDDGRDSGHLEIILQAKAQMYREGKHQWDENYPTVPILENDVRRGWGYVLVPEKDTPVQNVYDEATPFFNDHTGTDNGTSRQDIIAYGAVVFDGEPAYKGLWDGQWLSEQPYVVLHRLAVADRWKRQGMAVRYMQAVCDLALSRGIRSFKVDTNYDNFYMQRVFSRLGFTYCGRIRYDAGERMAYEKLL